jgi:hypothetical protein
MQQYNRKRKKEPTNKKQSGGGTGTSNPEQGLIPPYHINRACPPPRSNSPDRSPPNPCPLLPPGELRIPLHATFLHLTPFIDKMLIQYACTTKSTKCNLPPFNHANRHTTKRLPSNSKEVGINSTILQPVSPQQENKDELGGGGGRTS